MFKAYSLTKPESEDVVEIKETEFLQNSSYISTSSNPIVNISSGELTSSSSSESEESSSNNLKALEIYKRIKPSPSVKKEVYYVDKNACKEYLKMDSLPHRVLPKYRVTYRFRLMSGFYPKKFRRYFKSKKEKKSKKRKHDEMELNIDEEMRLYLAANQNDIDKWIEFIKLKVRNC